MFFSVSDPLDSCRRALMAERKGSSEHDLMTRHFLDAVIQLVEQLQRDRLTKVKRWSTSVPSSASRISTLKKWSTKLRGINNDNNANNGKKESPETSPSGQARAQLLGTFDAFFALQGTFIDSAFTVFKCAFIEREFESLDTLLKDLDQVAEISALQTKGKAEEYLAWHVKVVAACESEEAEPTVAAKRSMMPFACNVEYHEALVELIPSKFEISINDSRR